MGASRFVGRVGGLAVALGVGVAVFSGQGVAFADAGDSARSEPSTESTDSSTAGNPSPTHASRGKAAGRVAATGVVRGARANGATPNSVNRTGLAPAPAATTPARASAQISTASASSPSTVNAAASDTSGDNVSGLNLDSTPSGVAPPAAEPVPDPVADEDNSVAAIVTAADDLETGDAGTDPLAPAGSPMSWALLSVARRETIGAAAAIETPVALVTASAEQSNGGITVDPTVVLVDGVVEGTLNATSDRGLPMAYSFVGSSAGGKMDIGNVPVTPSLLDPQSYTILPYANWLDSGVRGSEVFTVRVSEVTDFDTFITGLPVVGGAFGSLISVLQDTPLLGTLLAPIIGSAMVAVIDVAVDELAPADTPIAFTYDVISFDGTPISTNYFPASGLIDGEDAPTALNPPGLGSAGATNPYTKNSSQSYFPTVGEIRGAGYNLITWDPRGEFASGGVLQLDSPFYEGRDTSAIVSWSASNTPAQLNGPDDPKVGMVGGSYGGGIQMTTVDPRIDAIVPGIAWHSLVEALYPNEIFKSAWSIVLGLSLIDARINSQIYEGVLTGLLLNWLSPTSEAVLASSGPTVLLNEMKAPTMFVQGTVDALFPLNQAIENAQTILANPYGTEVKMTWFCGGHGYCLDPVNPTQTNQLVSNTIAWLDTYVAGTGDPAEDIPVFQWYDQKGIYHESDLLPFQAGFNEPNPFSATGTGGMLPIIPFVGGSGPLQAANVPPYSDPPSAYLSWPVNQVFATEANNALNVAVNPNVGDQIVGAPELTFTYTGVGTGKGVFAQLVDNSTGRVLGNISTAVPVTLDGREHTVTVPMQSVAYTVGAGDSLTLQIAAYSTLYSNTSIGVIDISDIQLDLPIRAAV